MFATTATIRDAEDAIRRRFIARRFLGTLEYASDKVIETERWWYIPFFWIGCAGSAPTLEEVLTARNPNDEHGRTSHLTPADIQDLTAYVRSL